MFTRIVQNGMDFGKVMQYGAVIWHSNFLPAGYTPVQYLEEASVKGQWIDTGVTPSLSMQLDTKVYFQTAADDYFCSVRKDSGDTRYYLLNMNSNSGLVCTKDKWSGSAMISGASVGGLTKHSISIRSEISATGASITDVDRSITKSYSSNTTDISTKTLPLFGGKLNNSDSVTSTSPSGTRCYYAKFTDGGVVVRDFVPALDPSGRPCMFDLVTREPFYNKGSGEFAYNLFDEESPYVFNGSMSSVAYEFPYAKGGERKTFFMECKPDTTYVISWDTPGDRAPAVGQWNKLYTLDELNTWFNTTTKNPPVKLQTTAIDANSVTFTTTSTAKMVCIYYSYQSEPTGFRITESA